jgi:hypothetical protein
LLARVTVANRFGVGDTATGLEDRVRVVVEVLGPSWSHADRVELFADGMPVRHAAFEPTAGPFRERVEWDLPRPSHDVYLVAVASGPGVTDPSWALARPYQPTSQAWAPRVLAVTNPVFLDADGDGAWTNPRAYAARLVERVGTEPPALLAALAPYDPAVAAQAAELCQAAGRNVQDAAFTRELEKAGEAVRQGFAAFRATLRNGSGGE